MRYGKNFVPVLLPYKRWFKLYRDIEKGAGVVAIEKQGVERFWTSYRATIWYEAGTDGPTTERLMTHQVNGADLGTTYEGTMPEKRVKAVRKCDEILKGAWAATAETVRLGQRWRPGVAVDAPSGEFPN